MIVLGLGGSDHDTSACLVVNGRVVVSIEEERLARKKYALGVDLLGWHAPDYCLDAAGLTLADVEVIIADEILAPTAIARFRRRARRLDHHLCHAATAYYTSGFEDATIVVVDNAGGFIPDAGLQATSWYHGRGRELDLVGRVLSTNWHDGPLIAGKPYQRGDGDHSLGHFYKKVTGALGFGFKPPGAQRGFYFPEDGITMGLASFGTQRLVNRFTPFVELLPEGRYTIDLNGGGIDAVLADLLTDNSFESRADVAAAAQEILVRLLSHVVSNAIETTGETRVCLSGGVAMNCAATTELYTRTKATEIYVPPVPGDNGTGIGAALYVAVENGEEPLFSVYAGRSYGNAEIDDVLRDAVAAGFSIERPDHARLADVVGAELNRGEVVAIFRGGAEAGRRALGNRSLLADPRSVELRDYLNIEVKRRQWFRPYAPVVAEELMSEYFEWHRPSPYMQFTPRVRRTYHDILAGITHIDGTARLQTVRREQNPFMYDLLHAFRARASVAVLLNTSFNLGGEPIVETPRQALSAFTTMPIGVMCLEDALVRKN